MHVESGGADSTYFLDLGGDYTDVCFIIIRYTMNLYFVHLSVHELYFTVKFFF